MLLQARKLKEDYFTKERENKLPPKGNLKFPSGFYVGEEEFTLFVNPDMMDTLLEKTPIREVLGEEFYTLKKEVIDYVGNTFFKRPVKFFGDIISIVFLKEVFPVFFLEKNGFDFVGSPISYALSDCGNCFWVVMNCSFREKFFDFFGNAFH